MQRVTLLLYAMVCVCVGVSVCKRVCVCVFLCAYGAILVLALPGLDYFSQNNTYFLQNYTVGGPHENGLR